MSTPGEAQGVGSPARLRLLLLAVFVVATVMTVVGIVLAGDQRTDIAADVAKGGIQLGVIGLLTTAVTQALKRLNDQRDAAQRRAEAEREKREAQAAAAREDTRRLNEYRLTVFRDAVEAYNRIKTVRRTLRSAGLPTQAGNCLAPWQIDEFDRQMRILNEAELSLEKIEREVEARSELFPNVGKEASALTASQRYIRKVLNAWEKRSLLSVEPDVHQEKAIAHVRDFLAKRRERNMTDFWPYFNTFVDAIKADMRETPLRHT
jgi:hypothetical protein